MIGTAVNDSSSENTTARVSPSAHPRGLHSNARTSEVRRVLATILVLNFLVAAAKITFGTLTGSLAIAADGFHSIMDASGNVVALIGLAVSARPPDPNHPYGHHRYETLTSLGIAAVMLLGLFLLVQQAWDRLHAGGAPVVSAASFVVMLVTLAINITVTIWERRVGRRLSSSLLMADARHTASDIYVSVSVIVALIVVRMGIDWADAGITFLIAMAIAWGAWEIVRDATFVLSDAVAVEPEQIAATAMSVPGVEGTHNIRSRGGEGWTWVDLHIQVDPSMTVDESHTIASVVAREVEAAVGPPADVTVHVEPADEGHLGEERGHDPYAAGGH